MSCCGSYLSDNDTVVALQEYRRFGLGNGMKHRVFKSSTLSNTNYKSGGGVRDLAVVHEFFPGILHKSYGATLAVSHSVT